MRDMSQLIKPNLEHNPPRNPFMRFLAPLFQVRNWHQGGTGQPRRLESIDDACAPATCRTGSSKASCEEAGAG